VIKLSDVKVRLQYRLRVRQRLMVLQFARLQGPTAAARRFGVSVRTIRRWRVRWRQDALQGLVPRYPRRRGRRITPRVIELVGQARRDLAYGAQRTQLWLRRIHDVRVAVGTIQRIFRDLGLPRLRRTQKRVPRQMKLFEKAEPGESVQVDVKFVKIAGRWAFQYTALDDCTRFRVLRLYRRLHQSSSLAFLGELCRAFPFRIRKLQCACYELLVKPSGSLMPVSRWAVRSSSNSGMAPTRGSQRASFGLSARGNEECRAHSIGLAPVGASHDNGRHAPLSGRAGALGVTRCAASSAANHDRVGTPPVDS
jgi:transposase